MGLWGMWATLIVPAMCSRGLQVLMTLSICTYGRNMAYWIAYLSNIAHLGAICGYMGMFGLWNLHGLPAVD